MRRSPDSLARRSRLLAAGLTAVLAIGSLAACGDGGEADDAALPDQAVPGQADTGMAAPEVTADAATPDTTAESLWAYLEDRAYRAEWALWPGKGELYTGTEPHGMLLTTYVNESALQALTDGGAATLAAGAMIVKENFMPDSTFAATTVMYRIDGYNPAHEDWLFAKYGPDGAPQAFGRVESCQACHQQAETGYIQTPVER